jgi:RimJ/RimL family protein N-acetyltransferase
MILGQQIRLRPIERDDLPRFVKWFADPNTRQYIALHRGFSLDQETEWYERNLKAGDSQTWAIDAQPPDPGGLGPWVHIGSCGFHELDWRHRVAELGILIGPPDYWGRGYGTDAVRTLCGWGFNELNLHRIWLRVFADNERAQRCYEKAGFVVEGRMRESNFHNGAYRDTILMGLLRPEWPAQQAPPI